MERYSNILPGGSLLCAAGLVLSVTAQADTLNGVLQVATGSYFSMAGNVVNLQPGTDGGIILGQYQSFAPDPDVPHPQGWQGDINGDGIPDGSAGAGYNNATLTGGLSILQPFNFFGMPTYMGTNPVSYQSADAHPAPSADVDMNSCVADLCTLTVDLSAFEVFWNGNVFEQGPRPDNSGPFVLAGGTFNLATQGYVLDWTSQIKNGPFNGVIAAWHLEGTLSAIPVPAAIWLFGSGVLALFGIVKRRSR